MVFGLFKPDPNPLACSYQDCYKILVFWAISLNFKSNIILIEGKNMLNDSLILGINIGSDHVFIYFSVIVI